MPRRMKGTAHHHCASACGKITNELYVWAFTLIIFHSMINYTCKWSIFGVICPAWASNSSIGIEYVHVSIRSFLVANAILRLLVAATISPLPQRHHFVHVSV